jgi:hypothetical protein
MDLILRSLKDLGICDGSVDFFGDAFRGTALEWWNN